MSEPTSRWLIIERMFSWTNSIGSSIVTIRAARLRLMWWIIAASVVDLPEPVGAGDEDDPAPLVGEPRDHRRQGELLDRGNAMRYRADDERDAAAFVEGVDAEPRDARNVVRELHLVFGLEIGEPRAVAEQALEHPGSISGVQRRPRIVGERGKHAVQPRGRRRADLEVQV